MSWKFTVRVSAACLAGLTAACGQVLSSDPPADAAVDTAPLPPVAVMRAIELFPTASAAPVEGVFASAGGPLLVLAAGSGWSAAEPGTVGMTLTLDEGDALGEMSVWTNEPASHKAFVARAFRAAAPAGQHRLSIRPTAATSANEDDSVRATVLELGPAVKVAMPFASHTPTAPQVNVPFTSSGGTLLLWATASGYRETAGPIGMTISLASVEIGRTGVITNEVASHKSFLTSALVTRQPAGDHVLEIRQLADTRWDEADRITLGALEFDSSVTATQLLIMEPGPAPWTRQITTQGGILVIVVSASGFREDTAEPRSLGFVATIGDRARGTLSMYSNEAASHKALPSNFLVIDDLQAGAHAFRLEAVAGTSTDSTDYANVTVLEVPRS